MSNCNYQFEFPEPKQSRFRLFIKYVWRHIICKKQLKKLF